MVAAWTECFSDCAEVEIARGDLLDAARAGLVCPANSFGDMSGGLDKHIDDFYQGEAQKAIMAAIRERFCGELPVGASIVVEMVGKRCPFLIVAPTMRVPGEPVGPINAYLAMRGALVAILRYNESHAAKIGHVAVPGLCTGVGGMAPKEASQQMRAAYVSIIGGAWKDVVHPAMAPYAMSRRAG